MTDITPLIPNTCSFIHELLSETKNKAASANSVAVPILPKGCLLSDASLLSGVDIKFCAKGVSVKDGAMALTLIFEVANSAAKETVKPSTAPLEAATEAWKAI